MGTMDRNDYLNFALDVLNQFENYGDQNIRISFDQLRKNRSHERMMNRLAHCQSEYADVLYVHFSTFSLVLVYGNLNHSIYNYTVRHNKGNLSMTELKRTKDWFWTEQAYHNDYTPIKTERRGVFHVWEKPYLIRAKTDRVSKYYKKWENGFLVEEGNNFGDTENFYIIGSIHIYEK